MVSPSKWFIGPLVAVVVVVVVVVIVVVVVAVVVVAVAVAVAVVFYWPLESKQMQSINHIMGLHVYVPVK